MHTLSNLFPHPRGNVDAEKVYTRCDITYRRVITGITYASVISPTYISQLPSSSLQVVYNGYNTCQGPIPSSLLPVVYNGYNAF